MSPDHQLRNSHTASPEVLLHIISGLVNSQRHDLTARQLGLFLICYLSEEPQTVRGLAAQLGVSRPVISRALDRLGALSLTRRSVDHQDRRSILVRRTPEGTAFLHEISEIVTRAATQPDPEPKHSRPAPGRAR